MTSSTNLISIPELETSRPAWRARTPRLSEYSYNQQAGQIIYQVKPGDTLSKIYAIAQKYAKNHGLQVEQTLTQVREENGIRSPNSLRAGVLLAIRVQHQENTGPSCPQPTEEIDTVSISPSPAKIYEGRSERLEALEAGSYLDIINNPSFTLEQKARAIAERRHNFAQVIFNTLQQKGIIKPGTKFSTWWGWGGIGRKIEELIEDRDMDGYLDFNLGELRELLEKEEALATQEPNLEEALSSISTRFFKENKGNKKVLEYMAFHTQGQVPWHTGKDSILAAARASGQLRDYPVQEAQNPMAGYTLKSFLDYIKTTYGGKLCDNPALQKAFEKDIKDFLASHFVGAFEEKGAQVNVNNHFVLTTNNLNALSRDEQGRYRVNCAILAQACRMIFSAAGLKYAYYGSTIDTSNGPMGHVQVVGYIPGHTYMITNNNFDIYSTPKPYNAENARVLVEASLQESFGPSTRLLALTPGFPSQEKASSYLTSKGYVSLVISHYEKAMNSCFAIYSGLENIRSATNIDQLLNILAQRTGHSSRSQLRQVLIGYHKQVEKMIDNLEQARFSLQQLRPEDFPVTVQLKMNGKKRSYTFSNTSEMNNFINNAITNLKTYQENINRHLLQLENFS